MQNLPAADVNLCAPSSRLSSKSGAQKAREQIHKEKEKHRLKLLERERLQQERVSNRKKRRLQHIEELDGEFAKPLGQGRGAFASSGRKAASEARDADAAAPGAHQQAASGASPVAIAAAATAGMAPAELQASVRKLFALMDRNDAGRISRRDVLISMRRQPAIRRLFGLPDAVSATALEARLQAIQDSFEAGSGLGELEPVFGEFHGGSHHAFTLDSFDAACRSEPAKSRAAAAAALLPREHSTSLAFKATRSWAVVPEGAACPPGLEFKMDMASGRTLARLPL